MPRVHHVKANKDYPQHGIKKGEMYYHWSFRYGGKRYSKVPPKPAQLTQSEFLQSIYSIQERRVGLTADDGLPDAVQEIAQEIRDLGKECSDKLENMPEGFREGSSGQLLQERIEACEAAADELEGIDFDVPSEFGEGQEFEDEDAFWQAKLEEVQDVLIDAP